MKTLKWLAKMTTILF